MRTSLIFLSVLIGFGVSILYGASPIFWRVSTQTDFLEGEIDEVSIDDEGQLTLGPQSELLYETAEPFIWSIDGSGSSLWIGSGASGKVFRIDTTTGSAEIAFEAREQNIHAIAIRENRESLVGTSPNGAVYRVGLEEAELVFDPDDRYIWAIEPYLDDTFLVATGNSGKIYQVFPNGNSEIFYDADTTHVVALTTDSQNRVLAGTGTPGQVIRIESNGDAFVVLDSTFPEIRALHASSDGTVYAVAVGRPPTQATAPPVNVSSGPANSPTVSTSITVTATTAAVSTEDDSQNVVSPRRTAGPNSQGGAVYRIRADGTWEIAWSSTEDTPYDVTPDSEDRLLIGTGPTGKIYRVENNSPRVVLLTRVLGQQVVGFVPTANGEWYYATSNPGKLYRLSSNQARAGTYISSVRDTKTVSTWGALRWHATTPENTALRFFTRSGNTSIPNNTWSPWSDAYTNPNQSKIVSPTARYLQWKAELQGDRNSPTLLSVTSAYLPQNLRPRIISLTVHDPGIAFQQPFSSGDPPLAGHDNQNRGSLTSNERSNTDSQQPSLGRRVYRKGLQTFVWAADDRNNDSLRFNLLYRREADSAWLPLRTDMTESIFTWDTTSTPNGIYLLRVVASDAQSNSPADVLTGSLESIPFIVDNSQPRIEFENRQSSLNSNAISFTVQDSHSPILRVESSMDTEHWQLLYPVDGIADSGYEEFRIRLDANNPGRLVIRATDAMDNVTTAGAP